MTDSNSTRPARRGLLMTLAVAAAGGTCLTNDPTTARMIDDYARQRAEADVSVHSTQSDDGLPVPPKQHVQ